MMYNFLFNILFMIIGSQNKFTDINIKSHLHPGSAFIVQISTKNVSNSTTPSQFKKKKNSQ